MSAEVGQPLNKVDSHVEPESTKKGHGKSASVSEKVIYRKAEDVGKGYLLLNANANNLNWKMNTVPTSIDDKDVLKEVFAWDTENGRKDPVKKIDLRVPITKDTFLELTARNLKGVIIKDALDAIYKQNKKKADDELEFPYLQQFKWVEERKACFIDLQKVGSAPKSGKKKGRKGGDE